MIQAQYLLINEPKKVFQIYDEVPRCGPEEVLIVNATIEINGPLLSVSGKQILFEFTFSDKYVEDLPEQSKPEEGQVKFGYKTFLDFLKRKKKPYVSGWYVLDTTKEYKAQATTWFLIL
jgi:hypothetical protein